MLTSRLVGNGTKVMDFRCFKKPVVDEKYFRDFLKFAKTLRMEGKCEPESGLAGKKAVSGIRGWAEDDRPREKMILKGIGALSNAELIAILLRTGQRPDSALDLAQNLLKTVNHDLHLLGRLSIGDLTKVRGLGKTKAVSIMAALELGRRKQSTQPTSKTVVQGSAEAASLLQPKLADLRYEVFVVMFLSQSNHINHLEQVSSGGVIGTIADPKVIMKKALEHEAVKLILCHNHPSGNLNPSPEDIEMTRKLSEAAHLLDMRVLDHLIVASTGYYSFADHGRL